MILEIIYGFIVFALCFLFAREFMLCFIKDEEVIGHGVIYLHLISLMYILPAVTERDPGVFPRYRRFKDHTYQQFCKYGNPRACRRTSRL